MAVKIVRGGVRGSVSATMVSPMMGSKSDGLDSVGTSTDGGLVVPMLIVALLLPAGAVVGALLGS